MDQALQIWRLRYGISDEAYIQLHSILKAFQGAAHWSDSSRTQVLAGGSGLNDEGAIDSSRCVASEFDTINDVFRGYFSNGLLGNWHADAYSGSEDLDLSSHPSTQSPHDAPPLCGTSGLSVGVRENIMTSMSQGTSPTPTPQIPASASLQSVKDPTPACTRCWKRKSKCITTNSGICDRCSKCSIPAQLCIRERFTNELVFSKWKDSVYQSKLAWEHLSWTSSSTSAMVCHERPGPTLQISCCQFQRGSPEQTRIYYRIGNGWQWFESTSFALSGPDPRTPALDEYVSKCVAFYLEEVVRDGSWLGKVLQVAQHRANDLLMQLALKLWAANRLLMKGWQISGHETLGMHQISDAKCPLYGTVPAPRVLQNQLDRKLEEYIARAEREVLAELSRAMLRSREYEWVAVFAAVVIILHVRERDVWRLEYWVLNPESYQWRHPDKASALIQKSVHLSNLLLTHLHFCGEVPREFYSIEQMAATQEIDKAHSRYRWTDESSIDFALCRFAFQRSDEKRLKLVEYGEFGC